MIISKLDTTCLAIKTDTSVLSREDSRTLYYIYVHLIITKGVIFYVHNREFEMLCFASCVL